MCKTEHGFSGGLRIMSMAKADQRHKRPGDYGDPLLNTRAPEALIALVRAKAAERKLSVSALIREALARHIGSEAA
jgi:hypothetical protein